MAEFKKISEVDVVTELTENDNILVVGSDGALKQTASSNVKSKATGYFLTLSESNSQIDWDNFGVLCNENYDELYNVLMSGGSAWIDFAWADDMPTIKTYESAAPSILPEPTNFAGYVVHVSSWNMTDVGLRVECMAFGDSFIVIFPNGSHNLPAIEPPPAS